MSFQARPSWNLKICTSFACANLAEDEKANIYLFRRSGAESTYLGHKVCRCPKTKRTNPVELTLVRMWVAYVLFRPGLKLRLGMQERNALCNPMPVRATPTMGCVCIYVFRYTLIASLAFFYFAFATTLWVVRVLNTPVCCWLHAAEKSLLCQRTWPEFLRRAGGGCLARALLSAIDWEVYTRRRPPQSLSHPVPQAHRRIQHAYVCVRSSPSIIKEATWTVHHGARSISRRLIVHCWRLRISARHCATATLWALNEGEDTLNLKLSNFKVLW